MSIFSAMRTSASGLVTQRLRMDLISNNIANAETTRTAEGGAYRRQQVILAPKTEGPQASFFEMLRGTVNPQTGDGRQVMGVQTTGIVKDQAPMRMVYDPTHPDANENGYVEYPNVNPVVEMTDMLSATRSYEANVTVMNAAKAMAQRALDILR
jgi:flagellar basal-body rod protein FlgC